MDPALRIELARPRECPRLAEMSRDWIERGLAWRWRPHALLERVRDADTSVITARRGDGLVGFAVMSFVWRRSLAHLVLLAVDPAHRRCGIAASLLDWLEVVARRGGIDGIGLEVRATSAGARAFYERMGYRAEGRIPGYYAGREDAIRMVRALRRRSRESAADR